MSDLLQETDKESSVLPSAEPLAVEAVANEAGRLLCEHKGGDVVVMDMRGLNFWTDFFVIATATSGTHLSGLERHVKEFAALRGLELRRSRKPEMQAIVQLGGTAGPGMEEWCLIDLGNIVIHLMNERSRSFYELERLWSSATLSRITV